MSRIRPVKDPYAGQAGVVFGPNRNWARSSQRIYEVDPSTCLQCREVMRIISIIEDQEPVESPKGQRSIDKI